MGTLTLAAKITHVPSMYLCEFPGPHFGKRDAAIAGHKEIDRRCRALGVDTIVVFDVHWQVNSEYHLNCAPRFEGVYTSNELPHFIKNMPYAYPGNPELGHVIADIANEMGVKSRAHSDTTLVLEYGTLVPMRYVNSDQHYKVICVSGWCDWHDLEESQRFGLAVRRAIEERYDGTVIDMLPMYAEKCWGEGDMHDTAMLYGVLGGRSYNGQVEVITPYFGSSGTGQINAIFPVTPLNPAALKA